MNKIFKKITAMVTAAAMAASIASTVFADFVIDYHQVYGSAVVGVIDYYASGRMEITQQPTNYLIKGTTKIDSAIYLSGGNTIGNVSKLKVDWQVADYYTGNNFGQKQEAERKNAVLLENEEQISIYAPIKKFAVFGTHIATQNNTKIIADYTYVHN